MSTKDITYINLTPHDINVINDNNNFSVPNYSGYTIRVSQDYVDTHVDIIKRTTYGDVVLVNKNKQSTAINSVDDLIDKLGLDSGYYIFIVSSPVLNALKDKNMIQGDNYIFVAPDTGRALRDDNGRILGVPGFITL